MILIHSISSNMNYYLANFTVDNAAQKNLESAKAVAKLWDENWGKFFTGPVFEAIVKPCAAIAFVFFVISTVLIVFQWSQDRDDKNFIKLLSPLLIMLLLVGNGNFTRVGILGIRGVGNALDNIFLTKLQFDQNVNLKQQHLVGNQQVLQAIKRQADTCKASQGNPISDKACLVELNNLIIAGQASGILSDLQNLKDGIGAFVNGTPTATQVSGAVDALKFINPIQALTEKAIMSVLETAVFSILQLVTGAVQAMAEASFLMTALISPIFIAAALLPNGTKSLIALFTAFWSIINYKFCYIIIVGISAQMAIDDNTTNGIILAMISAIFAPILAAILASGAGMGFAKAATSAAGQTITIATKAASGGVL
jgi:hypothetical protein